VAIAEIDIVTGYPSVGKSHVTAELGRQLGRRSFSFETLYGLPYGEQPAKDMMDERREAALLVARHAMRSGAERPIIIDGVCDLETYEALDAIAPTRLIAVIARRRTYRKRYLADHGSHLVEPGATLFDLDDSVTLADHLGQEQLFARANARLFNDTDGPVLGMGRLVEALQASRGRLPTGHNIMAFGPYRGD